MGYLAVRTSPRPVADSVAMVVRVDLVPRVENMLATRLHVAPQARRSGVAIIEFSVVLSAFLVPVMLGLWEIGRLVHVQQVVVNATREGCRTAAQGITISSTGAYTQIVVSYNPTLNNTATTRLPNVKATICQSLSGAGLMPTPGSAASLQWSDVRVIFRWMPSLTGDPALVNATQSDSTTITDTQATADLDPPASGTSPTASTAQPFKGVKGQRFRITVSIPFAKVRWVNVGLVNPTTVSYTADWLMMVDETFSINTGLPGTAPNN